MFSSPLYLIHARRFIIVVHGNGDPITSIRVLNANRTTAVLGQGEAPG